MTQKDQAQRRRLMAKEVKSGETIGAVACRYGVSIGTVATACEQHGVKMRNSGKHLIKSCTFAMLLDLLNGKSQIDVARKNNCSRQLANNIAMKAVRAGFKMPEALEKRVDSVLRK